MRARRSGKRKSGKRLWLGRVGRAALLLILVNGLAVTLFFFWYYAKPPFQGRAVATVLLVGLDEPPRLPGSPRRADSIILCAVHLNGQKTTLLSVPRDARVRLPGTRRHEKINAAYAVGRVALLQRTLAQPDVMQADLPYYLVFDSRTVREVVDALGGITVTVPFNMHYVDHWGNLHIHLQAGTQRLSGKQAVGYLRWRKNNRGEYRHAGEDDFSRTERQRALLIAMIRQLRTPQGAMRAPAAWTAFRRHSYTNLTTRQFIALGWGFRNMHSEVVPGRSLWINGINYLDCDWHTGQQLWDDALR